MHLDARYAHKIDRIAIICQVLTLIKPNNFNDALTLVATKLLKSSNINKYYYLLEYSLIKQTRCTGDCTIRVYYCVIAKSYMH